MMLLIVIVQIASLFRTKYFSNKNNVDSLNFEVNFNKLSIQVNINNHEKDAERNSKIHLCVSTTSLE